MMLAQAVDPDDFGWRVWGPCIASCSGLLELVNSKSGHRTEGSAGSMGSILLFECETCQQNGFQDRYFVSKNFHKKTAS